MSKYDRLITKKYLVAANVLYCLKNTVKCYPALFIWCAGLIAVNIIMPILTTFLPKAVISAITDGSDVVNLIIVTLTFTLSIALLSGLKRYTERSVYHHRFKLNAFYLAMVAEKGLTTDYRNQEDERFSKLRAESFNCCNGNYSRLTQIYDVLNALASSFIGFVVYAVILARLNIFAVLFLFAAALASYFINLYIIKWTEENNAEKIEYGQKISYINSVSGDFKSAKDIRVYNMAVWLQKVYDFNVAGLSDWYRRYTAKVFGISAVDNGLSLLRDGAVYAYLIYLAISGELNAADFVLYIGVTAGFSAWLGDIFRQLNTLGQINISINHLRNYLEFPESYKREDGISAANLTDSPRKIELKGVKYRYEGAESDTLKGIDLSVEAGEHLAVVGLNGAGKTTLVKLVTGLTDPTDGIILYGGIDVREYNRIEFYGLFSAVFQQYSLLPVSLECIVSGVPENETDDEKVLSCLDRAGFSDKLASLPDGAKSKLGKAVYDDGIELSGGEIQKLLLARALYKDAPVMILDEPTAALDPIAENALYEKYDSIMCGKTAIFISHRLASTRFCDRILLLDNGIVIEEGTHESLLAAKGRYYELFETQAKYYRDNQNDGDSEVVSV